MLRINLHDIEPRFLISELYSQFPQHRHQRAGTALLKLPFITVCDCILYYLRWLAAGGRVIVLSAVLNRVYVKVIASNSEKSNFLASAFESLPSMKICSTSIPISHIFTIDNGMGTAP